MCPLKKQAPRQWYTEVRLLHDRPRIPQNASQSLRVCEEVSGIVLNRKMISTKKEVLLVLTRLRKTLEREREEKRARDSEDERERDDDNSPIYYMKR